MDLLTDDCILAPTFFAKYLASSLEILFNDPVKTIFLWLKKLSISDNLFSLILSWLESFSNNKIFCLYEKNSLIELLLLL